jgi:hypothetical protein
VTARSAALATMLWVLALPLSANGQHVAENFSDEAPELAERLLEEDESEPGDSQRRTRRDRGLRPLSRRKVVALATFPLLTGVGSAFLFSANMGMRREAREALVRPDSDLSCLQPPCDVHRLQKKWEDTRRAPYIFAPIGAALATAGVLTLVLHLDRRDIPWWASMLSATAGLAVSLSGVVDVVQGDRCNVAEKLPCAAAQEQFDRGAVKLIGAVPLFAMPIAQGIRLLLGSPNDGVAFFPGVDSRRSLSLNLRFQR